MSSRIKAGGFWIWMDGAGRRPSDMLWKCCKMDGWRRKRSGAEGGLAGPPLR